MKKLITVCAAFAFLYFSFESPATAEKADKFHRSSSPIAGRYIVVLADENSGSSLRDVEAAARDLSANYSGRVGKVYSSAVRGYSVEMSAREAERLSRDPRVKYVEEDAEVSAQQVVVPSPGWALDRIDQRTLPYNLEYRYNSDGTGVNVYVLDSGVMTTHDALIGRAFDAFNATSDNTPVENCNGHGTGVAGVVASTNYGTARNAMIYSVRILPCAGTGTVSDLVAGLDWVSRHALRPAVVNMSVRTSYSRTVNSSVTAVVRSGVTVVAAAGNDSGDACDYSPGSTQEAITVGAIDSTDTRIYYSNYGSCVSMFAPGEGVTTLWNSSPTAITYLSGTSFASPYVAGAAALYLGDHPTATPDEVKTALAGNATAGVVLNPGAATPNLLLYSLFDPPAPGSCNGATYVGNLPAPGSSAYQSNAAGFSTGAGQLVGTLRAPETASFDLTLEKKARGNRWSVVATTSATSPQQISYRGRSGTYRWRIDAVTGAGEYSLCSATP